MPDSSWLKKKKKKSHLPFQVTLVHQLARDRGSSWGNAAGLFLQSEAGLNLGPGSPDDDGPGSPVSQLPTCFCCFSSPSSCPASLVDVLY